MGRCVGRCVAPPCTAGRRAGCEWEKGAWCVCAFATAYMMEKKPAAIKILV